MEANKTYLLKLLSSHDATFFIPPYQRNYEWTQEQCQVFFDDVVRTYEANVAGAETKHFFGFVTFICSEMSSWQPERLVLIDGQQRITTTMLFLAAIRDLVDEPDLKARINAYYLINDRVEGDSDYRVKLRQVETDWPAFKHIALGEKLTAQERESAVYANYAFFCNQLKSYVKDGHRTLRGLMEMGLGEFMVVTLELRPRENSWENPQEIFESMNSLGKPLSLADLVRNYLLLGLDADDQSELYNAYWLKIERSVPHMVSSFIRDYMQARAARPYPVATAGNYKKLYASFKDLFAGADAQELLRDLERSSRIYAAIISGMPSGCETVDSVLSDLRAINVGTSYSFLLALLEAWKDGRFDNEGVTQVLEAFRIYCLRRRLMALNAAENKAFPGLVTRIGELSSASDKREKTFEILSGLEYNLRLPNDGELRQWAVSMNFGHFKYRAFYLALAEEALSGERPCLADSLVRNIYLFSEMRVRTV